MDKVAFDDFMKRRYYFVVNQYKTRAYYNQRTYRILRWIMIVLSMATAILLGSEQFFDLIPIKLVALITSVIVSGLATALNTFSYQEKWTFYNKMCTDLENEYDIYLANAETYSKADDKDSMFITRVNRIINEGVNTMSTLTIPRSRKSSQK